MSATQTITILIIMLKSPKVKILKGKVIAFNSGWIKKLSSPSTAPTRSKDWIPPVISTPGTNLSANHRLATPAISWNASLIIMDI